jgi:riboflavin kinase/FMN adenylyltransferase
VIFSSTRARAALTEGRPQEAAFVLGRPWEIEGRVEHGDKRGRTIGFPTANIALGDFQRPAAGVYAVRAGLDEGAETKWIDGVANYGRRPTFDKTDELLEVHLFDFNGDLYGQHLRVQMIDFIRPERTFDGLDALKAQISADADQARIILAAQPAG